MLGFKGHPCLGLNSHTFIRIPKIYQLCGCLGPLKWWVVLSSLCELLSGQQLGRKLGGAGGWVFEPQIGRAGEGAKGAAGREGLRRDLQGKARFGANKRAHQDTNQH